MGNVVEISNLKKYYHSGLRGVLVNALDGVSFSVKRGEVFGLLGPNGAGKSTAIKIILGLLRQNSGQCLVFGEKISPRTKSKIGYLPEAPNFYKFLTAAELVVFYARMSGMGAKEAEIAAKKSLEAVGLKDALNRNLSTFSKGMLQRAGLAQAIVHNPKLVILDEPNSGLDPVGMNDMAEMVLRLKREGRTVLICSHMLREVERLCDSVAILYKGSVAACGNLRELLSDSESVSFKAKNPPPEFLQSVRDSAEKFGVELEAETSAGSLADFFNKIILERSGK